MIPDAPNTGHGADAHAGTSAAAEMALTVVPSYWFSTPIDVPPEFFIVSAAVP